METSPDASLLIEGSVDRLKEKTQICPMENEAKKESNRTNGEKPPNGSGIRKLYFPP